MALFKKKAEEKKEAKPKKKKIRWKWKACKYVLVPALVVTAGFAVGASYGARHPDSWVVKSSSTGIEYVQKGAKATGEYISDTFSGRSDEDNVDVRGGIEDKVERDNPFK